MTVGIKKTTYAVLFLLLTGLLHKLFPIPQQTATYEISRHQYQDKLYGFWLGQNIGNWTGLITEMDKVGTEATLPFYTDDDWGQPDLKAMWGEYVPHADRIDFYFQRQGTPWGADDDTDIEYMYLYLHHSLQTGKLSAEQIREGWLKHIYSETDAPLYKKFANSKPQIENFLWESNQTARELMEQGMLPPHTSEPANNSKYMMIDAQLTTEIFGLLAPGRPDIALDIARLPIGTTAKYDAQWIAEFYVVMHCLTSVVDSNISLKEQTQWLADQASQRLPKGSTAAAVYRFVADHYQNNPHKNNWELTRDAIYQRYQLDAQDGYEYRQPFDAVINFAASLVSLFYGEGDIVRTLQIGTLAGWDSDNPTATWGGLLGFMLGKQGVEQAFGQSNLSDTYWIHRTRRNFPDQTENQAGENSLTGIAKMAVEVVDTVVIEQMHGAVDAQSNRWIIPAK
ncbi:MAG: ADP-ribosylglycohydrolase family protein [Porticoccaceae bacterium]|nr:ADP-ribosylglycohydrolase family protein [Porticoccaceae bacterium]